MSSPADMAEAMLGRFAELSLELAAGLQARALATEDDEQAARIASAFHQVGRSLRQSLALRDKLRREAREDQARRDERKARVRKPLEREVWREFRGYDAQNLCRELERFVEEEAEDPDFMDADVEAMVAALRARLPLTGVAYEDKPAIWMSGDDEDDEDEDEDYEDYEDEDDPGADDDAPDPENWRSSA
ncbi:hypothetical protein [Phenylobacterium sp.]|uniref:hypothetical protein n=1 Tax=Phenylobacterium sp. TaxID=1871053 RepID=UPI00391BD0BD